MEEVNIFSNWNPDGEEKLKNLLSFTSPGNKECEIEKVTKETCIRLTDDENGNIDSKPELTLKSENLITEIKILSEGSLIEVFGLHDEYLFTCVSEFIDDWEGMAVYHSVITLPAINSCRLKFTRIKEKGRLWLYSISLSMTKSQESPHMLFNFNNVNNLSKNPNQQMSEKAKEFSKLFELYVKNSSPSQNSKIQSLLSIINRECNHQYLDGKQSIINCLNSTNSHKLSENNKKSTSNKTEFSAECQFLKEYIDSKFVEMKDDLMKHMENKLEEFRNENNLKLNFIMKLLEVSKL